VKPLEFRPGVWPALMADLYRRGLAFRESGAFLLGKTNETGKVVHEWLSYDELDPVSLNYEYVRLGTNAFSKLWAECDARRLEVVADVHTHPRGPRQSRSDRANPMISLAGHVALIVPNFAHGVVQPSDISVNVYLGGGAWQSYFQRDAAALIKLSSEVPNGC
jgi:proteasome lid subunit RPN8/RPN11